MSDPIEARMNFIIEQQAQFVVGMQALNEQQANTQRRIGQLVDVTMSLAHHAEETDRSIQEMDQRLGARIDQLVEAGAHSDRRLDALIDTVDKLVRRNGG
jgi:glycine cleavage system aminomethyltransferase T